MRTRIKHIEEELGEENAKNNFEKIKSLEALGGESDCMNTNGMWNMKKKIFPKIKPQVPTGKKNQAGKIVTNQIELKELYLEEYIGRLRNRPMHPDMKEIQIMEEDLFYLRNELARETKSEPFKMEELDNVLSSLKENRPEILKDLSVSCCLLQERS